MWRERVLEWQKWGEILDERKRINIDEDMAHWSYFLAYPLRQYTFIDNKAVKIKKWDYASNPLETIIQWGMTATLLICMLFLCSPFICDPLKKIKKRMYLILYIIWDYFLPWNLLLKAVIVCYKVSNLVFVLLLVLK